MAGERRPIGLEIVSLLAQGAAFVLGLAIALVVGMVLAAYLDGPGGLLIATITSGVGLLVAAGASQWVRDHILFRDLE
jgi:hypothetical protein